MTTPPKGCLVFPVTDGRSAPHLRPGEFAIIDTNDRDPIIGELFLIQWSNGRRAIVMVTRGGFGRLADGTFPLWVGAMVPDTPIEGKVYRYIDGPYSFEHLKSKLLGRVIAVMGTDAWSFPQRLENPHSIFPPPANVARWINREARKRRGTKTSPGHP